MSNTKVSFGERFKKAIGIEGDTKKVVFPMLNYTATNISTSGASYFFSLYYIPFLVYVEGLSPSQVGLIILIKSIWDAITDPLMGVITDRTHSKYGKHRFWIIVAVIPFVVTFFMTWFSFGLSGHASSTTVMLYYIAAYVLFSTATTVLTVPHTAMLLRQAAKLSQNEASDFVDALYNNNSKTFEALISDVEYFTLKFDYRNTDKPWGTSKDSIQRSMRFLSSDGRDFDVQQTKKQS